MATIKGTSIVYGIASNATTGVTGEAAVTSLSGGNRAETKRIKDNTGDTMSFVISDQSREANATIVCADTLELSSVGDVIDLSNFDGGTADLNGKYYCTSADTNHSNESELTQTLSLLRLNGTPFTAATKDLA
jgi:hypothetical protein